MPRFTLDLQIARPPEDVFGYLTDVERLPEWQSTASSSDVDGPVQLGTRIRERRTFIGRDVTTELEVTGYDRPRRFDVTARGGPVPFSISHALEASDGGTRLRVDVDVKLSGMLRIAAQGPLELAKREFRADFRRFKERLEGPGYNPPANPGA
jgi:carbon monoxide dehydrogenase subunit G